MMGEMECGKHSKQMVSFVCTVESCPSRRMCEQCKTRENLHFTQHANFIYRIKDFLDYSSSKELIPRLEKGIQDSENFINHHKAFYNDQIRCLNGDFEQIVEQFREINESYRRIYVEAFEKEMGMFDGELRDIKTLLKEYLYEKNEQESFFSRLFSNQPEKQQIEDLVKKNGKVFKVRAAIINLRSKIAMAKTNKTSYRTNPRDQAKLDELKDYLKQFSIGFYDRIKELLNHEGSTNLKSSIVAEAKSLSSSQVSQNTLGNSQVSINSQTSLAQSDIVLTTKTSTLSEKNLSLSQVASRVKVTLPDPHPNVLKVIKLLKPIEYRGDLPMLSAVVQKRDEGPFRYNLGTYFGTYEQGVRSGKGIFIFSKDGSFYEGTWEKDNMSGYGRLVTQNSYYEGEIVNGLAHGIGTYENSTKVYSGEWRNDQRSGKGEEIFKSRRCRYKGEFAVDKYQGYGVLEDEEFTYSGEFKEGTFNGDGTIRYKNGEVFVGKFRAGERVQGKHTMLDGSYFDGQYDGNTPNGKGQFRWADGIRYVGPWRNGLQEGEGFQIGQNNRQMKGIWKGGVWVRWV